MVFSHTIWREGKRTETADWLIYKVQIQNCQNFSFGAPKALKGKNMASHTFSFKEADFSSGSDCFHMSSLFLYCFVMLWLRLSIHFGEAWNLLWCHLVTLWNKSWNSFMRILRQLGTSDWKGRVAGKGWTSLKPLKWPSRKTRKAFSHSIQDILFKYVRTHVCMSSQGMHHVIFIHVSVNHVGRFLVQLTQQNRSSECGYKHRNLAPDVHVPKHCNVIHVYLEGVPLDSVVLIPS